MSKAVLVMDMPSSCLKCPIGKNMSITIETCIQCPIGKCAIDEDAETIPDWCPLREEPKKKNDNPLASDTMYKYGYAQGYNACIDEILGD